MRRLLLLSLISTLLLAVPLREEKPTEQPTSTEKPAGQDEDEFPGSPDVLDEEETERQPVLWDKRRPIPYYISYSFSELFDEKSRERASPQPLWRRTQSSAPWTISRFVRVCASGALTSRADMR